VLPEPRVGGTGAGYCLAERELQDRGLLCKQEAPGSSGAVFIQLIGFSEVM